MLFYNVSFLNAARFARGRGFGLFLTERVTYQELPQSNAKCFKRSLINKMGRFAPHLCRPFWFILRYVVVTLGP